MPGDWSVYYKCLGILDTPEHVMTIQPQNAEMADVQRVIESYKEPTCSAWKTWNF